MLPVPYQYLVTPVVMVDKTRVPYIPYVSDQRVQHLLADIAARLINTAAESSNKNQLRMFCYNLISQNNWFNSYFEDLFHLAIGQLLVMMSRNPNMPASALYENAADTALALYTSSLITLFPELYSVLDPGLVRASEQNIGLLQNLNSEISRMSYPGQPPRYPQPPYGYAPQANYPQPQPGYPQPGYPPYPPGYPPPGYPPPPPGYPPPGQPQHIRPTAYGAYPGPPGYTPGTYGPYGQSYTQDYSPRPDPTLTHDFSDHRQPKKEEKQEEKRSQEETPHQYQRFTNQREYFSKPQHITDPFDDHDDNEEDNEATNVSDEKTELYDVNSPGETDMDRNRHEIIVDVPKPSVSEENPEDKKVPEIELIINNVPRIDFSLNIAITEYRAKMIKDTKEKLEMYRHYVYSPTFIVSIVDVMNSMNKWLKGDTLSEIAKHMQSIIDRITPDGDPTSRLSATISLIRELDQKLTDRVNSFLKDVLEATYSIETFIGDYPDKANEPGLPQYVLKKSGKIAANALKEFEQNFIAEIRSEFLQNTTKESDIIELPENVSIGYIPMLYTLTMIPLDRARLKLPSDHKVKILDSYHDQLIYQTAHDLYTEQNPNNPFGKLLTDYHLLVTRDGVCYRIGQKVDGTGKYYVKRF